MPSIDRIVKALDEFQQKRRFTAFPVAVIKKYGDDQSGYQAALLTYYGFLALFPLLMILTTFVEHAIGNNPALKETVIDGVTDYFPMLGNQLSSHVEGLSRSGPALIVGLLFALYGARGVADAFRLAMQKIWKVPKDERDGFPKAQLKSLALIFIGGAGLLLAQIIAGLTAAAGPGIGFHLLSIGANLFILFWLFTFLINFSLPRHVTLKEARIGAAVAAIGLVILQAIGGYLLAHELRNLDALYSYFAISLGLLFWIYLQAQLLCYAATIAVVSSQKLWPRSLVK